jgi:hypothetical protein
MKVWYPGPNVRAEHRGESQHASGHEIKPGWNDVPDALGADFVTAGFCAADEPAAEGFTKIRGPLTFSASEDEDATETAKDSGASRKNDRR